MTEILGMNLGNITSSGASNVVQQSNPLVWMWYLVAIMGIILCGIIIFLIYHFRTYRWRLVVHKYINGRYVPFKTFRARTIRLTAKGDDVLWVWGAKRFVSAYQHKLIGKRTYYFAVTPDGYWINFDLGDLDTRKGVLDIEPVFASVRYMHEGINMNAEMRYNKKSLLEQYAPMILLFIFFIVCIIGMYIIFAKLGKLIDGVELLIDKLQPVIDKQTSIINSFDNVCNGGTGLVKV